MKAKLLNETSLKVCTFDSSYNSSRLQSSVKLFHAYSPLHQLCKGNWVYCKVLRQCEVLKATWSGE